MKVSKEAGLKIARLYHAIRISEYMMAVKDDEGNYKYSCSEWNQTKVEAIHKLQDIGIPYGLITEGQTLTPIKTETKTTAKAKIVYKYKMIYTSIDGSRITKKYRTIEGARKFATEWVGKYPSLGSTYAVSDDGVGQVSCQGCTIRDIFTNQTGL